MFKKNSIWTTLVTILLLLFIARCLCLQIAKRLVVLNKVGLTCNLGPLVHEGLQVFALGFLLQIEVSRVRLLVSSPELHHLILVLR